MKNFTPISLPNYTPLSDTILKRSEHHHRIASSIIFGILIFISTIIGCSMFYQYKNTHQATANISVAHDLSQVRQ